MRERRLNRLRVLSRALNPTTEAPPSNLTYFYGGMSTSYGNAKGIVDQGLPIGVVLPTLPIVTGKHNTNRQTLINDAFCITI